MVIPMPPPFDPSQVQLDRPFVTSTSIHGLRPKMKPIYSLNPFCGCKTFVVGEEPCNDYVTDTSAYMRAAGDPR